MAGLVKIVATTVAVITVACGAAILMVPPVAQEEMDRRRIEARRYLIRIVEGISNYYNDHGDYPPGLGSGSAELVRALQSRSKEGVPYMAFPPEHLSSAGDILNPACGGYGILYYRNNLRDPARNRGRVAERPFDLWGDGADGRLAGVNSWD